MSQVPVRAVIGQPPDLPAAKPECEHYWASHVYDGLSVRLCQFCHEPDWDDFRRQLADAATAERERCAQLAERVSAIYALPQPMPTATVNGEPVGDTTGNAVIWPGDMPAIRLFGCLLRDST